MVKDAKTPGLTSLTASDGGLVGMGRWSDLGSGDHRAAPRRVSHRFAAADSVLTPTERIVGLSRLFRGTPVTRGWQ